MKKLILRIITTCCLVSMTAAAYAEKPLAGLFTYQTDSARTFSMMNFIESHFENIIYTTGVFEALKTRQLKKELVKFRCVDEKCLLRFSRSAGLSVLFTARIRDRNDSVHLTMVAYGLQAPYYGKIIYRYSVSIPVSTKLSNRKLSYICEEHSGYFFAGMFNRLQLPRKINTTDGKNFTAGTGINGKYRVFRYRPGLPLQSLGIAEAVTTVTIKNGIITENASEKVIPGDFIYVTFKDKGEFLEQFYTGRKREIVLNRTGYTDTMYTVLLTVPISATMPVITPLFGYYSASDWSGLGLWTLNYSPYFYLEYKGFSNDPDDVENEHKTVSREVRTNHRFAWYMLLVGGLPLFVDAVSHNYLFMASNYETIQSYMGNDLTAGYLSLVSGGGGHFYRGNRAWGYFYFHLNNVLVYSILWELSPERNYNTQTGKYSTAKIDYTRLYTLIGIYGTIKIIEVVHAVLSEDNIRNGVLTAGDYRFEPVIGFDRELQWQYGLQCSYHF